MANLQDFRVKRGIVVATSANVGGNVSITGNTTVTGQTVFSNTATLNGPAFFNSTASFQGGNVAFNTTTLIVDYTNSRVAINAASSTVALFVQGTANVSGQLNAANVAATNATITNINGNTLTLTGTTNSTIGTSTLHVNPSLNRIGINTSTPDAPLSLVGAANISANAWVGGSANVIGAATFSNTVGVTGAVTLSSTLNVTSDTTIVSGNVALSNTSKFFVGNLTGTANGILRTVTPGAFMFGGGQLLTDVTLNVNATSTNIGSTVVARDASGNFSANSIAATTVTANLTGTAQYSTYAASLTYAGGYRTATDAATGTTIMARDANGSFAANVMSGTATSARYADLAELYLADDEYPVGTVMTIGGEKEITAYTSECSIRALGTISENPAYLMNSELEGGVPVALKGRVPVRVIGSIKKGQGLGASSIPGVATLDALNYFAVALEGYDDFSKEGIVEAVIL